MIIYCEQFKSINYSKFWLDDSVVEKNVVQVHDKNVC